MGRKKTAAPVAEAVPEPEPVVEEPIEEEEAEEGDVQKKKRRRAGANKKAAGAGAHDQEYAALRKEKEAEFKVEMQALRKQLPGVKSLGSTPTDQIANAPKVKEALIAFPTKVQEAINRTKVIRPKKVAAQFADTAESFNAGSADIEFQAWRKFATDAEALQTTATDRIREVSQVVDVARDAERKNANASRIAAVKGCSVESLDMSKVTQSTFELDGNSANVMLAPVNLSRRFEKQFGCLVEQAREGKGKGKGVGPPKLSVMGLNTDVVACVKAIKETDLSFKHIIDVGGKRVGNIIGPGGANLRVFEETHKVYFNSQREDITVYGPKANVEKAVADFKKQLEDASSECQVDVGLDKAKVFGMDGGRHARAIETDSGAFVRAGKDDGMVNIRGSKVEVTKAKAAVEKFAKSLVVETVKLSEEVLDKMYTRGERTKGENVNQEFNKFRDFGVTMNRKEGGIAIIGDKKKVAEVQKGLVALGERALYTTLSMELDHYKQCSVLTDTVASSIGEQTKTKLYIRRATTSVDIVGSESGQQAAKEAIQTLLDAEGTVAFATVGDAQIGYFQGRVIQEHQDKLGVKVSFSRGDGSLVVMGSKADTEKAKQTILAKAAKWDTAQSAYVEEEIDVEPEQIGFVIGKGGATAKWIMKNSGVESVNVKRGDGDEGDKVVLRGYPDKVKKAMELVAQAIEERDAPEEAATAGPVAIVKKVAAPQEAAPNIESDNLFPSLGAALGAGGAGKKKQRGRSGAMAAARLAEEAKAKAAAEAKAEAEAEELAQLAAAAAAKAAAEAKAEVARQEKEAKAKAAEEEASRKAEAARKKAAEEKAAKEAAQKKAAEEAASAAKAAKEAAEAKAKEAAAAAEAKAAKLEGEAKAAEAEAKTRAEAKAKADAKAATEAKAAAEAAAAAKPASPEKAAKSPAKSPKSPAKSPKVVEAAPAAAAPVKIGDMVQIFGLQGRPELNGQSGTICMDIDEKSGRYAIKLPTENVKVKPANFALVVTGSKAGQSPKNKGASPAANGKAPTSNGA